MQRGGPAPAQCPHSPSLFSSRAAITASSSTGFREHVEYTIRPPSASCSAPRVAIRSWRLRVDLGLAQHPPPEQRPRNSCVRPYIQDFHGTFTMQTKQAPLRAAGEFNVILYKQYVHPNMYFWLFFPVYYMFPNTLTTKV